MRQDVRDALAFHVSQVDVWTDFCDPRRQWTVGCDVAFGGDAGFGGAPAAHDRLGPGQALGKNQAITSSNGQYKFILQTDGNAVVYQGAHPLWATNTAGKPVVSCVMQTDGNLVLYGADRRAYWASNTAGKGASTLVMQTDNNLVIYQGGGTAHPTWSSRGASQHGPFDAIASFVTTAVSACGKEIGKGLNTIAGGLHAIQNAIAKIPVIGGVLATLYDLGSAPFTTQQYVAAAVANGEHLDKALLDNLGRLKKELTDVLPWVCTIISCFPVFGPLVSSIIMTANALLEGAPLEEVAIEAALSAIPGMAALAHFAGPIIEFGIRLAKAVASHQFDFGEIIADGLTAIADILNIVIPDFIREALKVGVNLCAALARGMKATDALLHAGIDLLKQYGPQLLGEAYKALHIDDLLHVIGNAAASAAEKLAAHIGIAKGLSDVHIPDFPAPLNDLFRKVLGCATALGSAVHIQATISNKVKGIADKLVDKGKELASNLANQAVNAAQSALAHAPAQLEGMAKDFAIAQARKLVPPDALKGFDLAIGLSQHTCNPFQMITLRDTLDNPQKRGFDTGMALHIGRVAVKPPPPATFMGPTSPAPSAPHIHMASFGPDLKALAATKMAFAVPPGFAIQWPATAIPKVAQANAASAITVGLMALGPPEAKEAIMTTVASTPEGQAGATHAIAGVAAARAADPTVASVVHESAWHRFLAFLHIHPFHTAVPVHPVLAAH